MYIPPQLRQKSWQHGIIGAVLGGIVAYGIIMFMYGTMYEELLEDNVRQEAKISELIAQNESLKDDQEAQHDNQVEDQLKIQAIDVVISNREALRLDRLTNYQLEELIKKEIDHLIGQDLESTGDNVRLLTSTLENKTFILDDTRYYFEVERIIISRTIALTLKARLHQ